MFSLVRYSQQKTLFRKVTHQIEWALATGETGRSELPTFVLLTPPLRIIRRKFSPAFCLIDLVVFGQIQQPPPFHCRSILHGYWLIPCRLYWLQHMAVWAPDCHHPTDLFPGSELANCVVKTYLKPSPLPHQRGLSHKILHPVPFRTLQVQSSEGPTIPWWCIHRRLEGCWNLTPSSRKCPCWSSYNSKAGISKWQKLIEHNHMQTDIFCPFRRSWG